MGVKLPPHTWFASSLVVFSLFFFMSNFRCSAHVCNTFFKTDSPIHKWWIMTAFCWPLPFHFQPTHWKLDWGRQVRWCMLGNDSAFSFYVCKIKQKEGDGGGDQNFEVVWWIGPNTQNIVESFEKQKTHLWCLIFVFSPFK